MSKLLILLTLFNTHYNLEDIQCPTWVPGSEEVVPAGIVVNLTKAQKLDNAARCYCEVVKAEERDCLARHVPKDICLARTSDWLRKNLKVRSPNFQLMDVPVRGRDLMINVRP
jgi:hypothetical protein